MAATLMRVVLACPNPHETPRERPKQARSADHDQRLYMVVKLSLSFSLSSDFSFSIPLACYPLLYASRASSFSQQALSASTYLDIRAARSCMRSHGSWNDYRLHSAFLSSSQFYDGTGISTLPTSHPRQPVSLKRVTNMSGIVF